MLLLSANHTLKTVLLASNKKALLGAYTLDYGQKLKHKKRHSVNMSQKQKNITVLNQISAS